MAGKGWTHPFIDPDNYNMYSYVLMELLLQKE